jgi:hypothetical protein
MTTAVEVSTPVQFKVWADDSAAFSTHRVCRLHDNFHEHALMQLPQLAELAKALFPTNQCRFIKPGSTVASKFEHAAQSHDGRDIDEVFRRIEEPGSWLALYNVETNPKYRSFLNEVTAGVRQLVDPEQPGMTEIGGFIFISAPPSVTPFHIDRENNFWLQVAGRKTINIWEPSDRVTVAGPLVENFILTGGLSEVVLKEEHRSRSHEFDVGAGDGVYFPSTSPHMTHSGTNWARPGDGVSISIGVVFYTDVTRQHAHIHALNRVLRKFGISPRVPGESALIDGLKSPFANAIAWDMRRRGFKRRGF